MSLIACPECKQQVSDQANACIHCGYPLQKKIDDASTNRQTASAQPRLLEDNPAYARDPDFAREPLLADNPNYSRPPAAQAAWTSNGEPIVVRTAKSRGVYIILGLFFGLLGVHNFYAGYLGRGLAQLLILLFLGWFVVGIVIVAIWALIELFVVTTDGSGNAFA